MAALPHGSRPFDKLRAGRGLHSVVERLGRKFLGDVPTGLESVRIPRTRHFRGGLSYPAASRLKLKWVQHIGDEIEAFCGRQWSQIPAHARFSRRGAKRENPRRNPDRNVDSQSPASMRERGSR